MDFRFSPEQEQFRDSVRRFAEKELAPARAGARTRGVPWDVAQRMARRACSASPSPRPTAGRAAA